MLEKTKKFVSDHKSQIITAAVSAAVGGAAVFVYYQQKTLLHVPDRLLNQLVDAPERKWAGFDHPKGFTIAMTVLDKTES